MSNDRHPDNVDLLVDWGELEGFQFPSRQRGIDEWRQRKDDEEFERLCNRLRVRKWKDDNPDRRRDYVKRHYRANKARLKARASAWYQANRNAVLARRHAEVVEARQGRSCDECGASLDNRRSDARYCSKPCQQRGGYKRRGQGKARVDLRAAICGALRDRPWQTARQIADSAGAKYRSVASKLTLLRRQGAVVTDGSKHGRRYALADNTP